jgi:hypothetical protein
MKLFLLVINVQWIQQGSVFWKRSLWIKQSKIDAEMKYAGLGL